MFVRIESFFRKMWRLFSLDDWMGRLLNLSKIQNTSAEPGLVLIQIDGLGLAQFERAVKNGNMPFLARLQKKEGYVTYRHYAGLPSNTPSVHGRLFYGVKSCVPAFSFKDSRTGKIFNMFSPESSAAVEDRIKDSGEPLLKGGSAYGNIFTGGAKESHFCASSMGWGGLLKAANPFGIPLTILLHFHIFIRALFLIGVEFILAVIDSVRGILSGKKLMSEIRYIPLRVAVCVLLREIIAAGARIDISRGVPVIHINLAGYDEQAHHRGPSSTFAHWSLRGIDSTVAKVWKAAHGSPQREYGVFIYSDHGQEDTVSYVEENGRTIHAAVSEIFKKQTRSVAWQMETSQGHPYWRAHALKNQSRIKKAAEFSPPGSKSEDAAARVVVAAMGNVGLIYPPEPLSSDEKETLAGELIVSAKVPFVMTKDGPGRAIAWNARGKYIFPEEADQVLEVSHPFFKEVARDLIELCHHEDSGELLIFGWRKGLKSLTFHGEQGSHAGPGPKETSGFALLPTGALPRDFAGTMDTQDLRDAAFRAQDRVVVTVDRLPSNLSPTPKPTILRIMTYNVHGCMGRDGKISPNRIARIIAKHDPDVIALQELSTSPEAHQAELIAQKLAMTFHFHPALSIKKGQRGNAIFSKFPMRPIRNEKLPGYTRIPFLEPRGALWVEIDRDGKKVQIINTHLSLSSAEGLLQIKALCGPSWLGNPACQGSVVFCGDLNALSNSKICKYLGSALKNTHAELTGRRALKTLPSYFPLSLVDHVFVGPGLSTHQIEVPRTELERMASDHLPLIVDVQVEPSPIEI